MAISIKVGFFFFKVHCTPVKRGGTLLPDYAYQFGINHDLHGQPWYFGAGRTVGIMQREEAGKGGLTLLFLSFFNFIYIRLFTMMIM